MDKDSKFSDSLDREQKTDGGEAELEGIVSGAGHILYGYHQGPPPRAGHRVQRRKAHQTATVLGVHYEGRLFVVSDDDGKVYCTSTDGIQTVTSSARLGLYQLLLLAKRLAAEGDRSAPYVLASHFRGMNGSRYACPAAHAWCLRAMSQMRKFGSRTEYIERWIQKQSTLALRPFEFPGEADIEDINSWAERNVSQDVDGELDDASKLSICRAIDLGSEFIELAATDDELRDSYRQDRTGALATDSETGLQVVVLGPSKSSSGEGFVDTLRLDDLEASARHLSGLSVSNETIDPAWLWEAVTGSALQAKQWIPAALWLASHDVGPSGNSEPSETRNEVRTLGASIGSRLYQSGRKSHANRWLRIARESWRLLPKPSQAKFTALIPELISSTKPRSQLDHKVLIQEFRSAIGRMLIKHPVPEIRSNRREVDDVSEFPPVKLLEFNPATAEDGDPEISRNRTVSRIKNKSRSKPDDRVRFEGAQRQLRFALSEHQLLASEWALPKTDTAFADAVSSALAWLESRMGLKLPKAWRDGAHEIERHGVSLQIESNPAIFSFRLDHPDTEYPTRWWRSEVTLLSGQGAIGGMAGVRLAARDLVELPPPSKTVPAVIRGLADNPGLLLAGASSRTRTHVRDRASLDSLTKLIADAERDAPLWVTRSPFSVTKSLQGLARIIILENPAEDIYSISHGKLPDNALHLYGRAGRLPICIYPNRKGDLERLRVETLSVRQRPNTPSFREVRDAIASARLHNSDVSPTSEDIRELISREVKDYEELLEVAEEERERAFADRDAALQELEKNDDELNQLRWKLHSANAQIRSANATASITTTKPAAPATLDAIAEWVPHLQPRLVLADKAIRTASKTNHQNPALIYEALEQMADSYWVSRWGDEAERQGAHEQWTAFLEHNRLRWSGVGTAINNARYAEEYSANIDGKNHTMTMHVAGSSTHDPTRCLRIYCYPDEYNRRIIIGHLPTHLTSGHT
ncbi:hypothetical protein [Xanthomonas campestris]|uniref:hypothetical protein n=1 Tax=Xanthomonas campestris TaxID=339 RepID=UPI002B2223B6|nr:hypothetical protein [Xanthomonas campestris]MEA9739789.1 hypothetical protein [Xanthomonas campestris pv. raphani]MEA9920643.1 hypothetical protein [Xanthomonas campestris pv. raphani]MEA9949522.1 hypothetical protein [Xanthomonas campestris pv. raphani]